MAGHKAPWVMIPSALALSATPVVAAWAARFRQEDGCRDHQHRLGLEECLAWTKEPILGPLQVPLMALTWLRLLHARRDQAWGPGSWWLTPAWTRRQRHASILDLRRLCWRDRAACSPFLIALEDVEKIPQPLALSRDLSGRAA